MPSSLRRYVAAVTATGLALLVAVVAAEGAVIVEELDATLALCAGAILLAELFPLVVPRHDVEATFSTTFGFALLLVHGTAATALTAAAMLVLADALRRRPPVKVAFNAAQYALSWLAAGMVLQALAGDPARDGLAYLEPGAWPALLPAAATFLAVNLVLTSVPIALATGRSPLDELREDLAFQLWTTGVLVALAPIVVVVAAWSPWLVPVLGAPLAAIQRGGRAAVVNEHQARHDALTGLANRTRLRECLAEALRGGREVTVVLLDLDGFKAVNDALGHQHGDRLLIGVARRLEALTGPGELAARFGGDEFALLLRDADPERVLGALAEPVVVEGVELDARASAGSAASPADGADPDTLLRRADVALSAAKERRASWAAYEEALDRETPERIAMLPELRRAIDAGELVLHYQPKLDLRREVTAGVEALVRWPHPRRGLLAAGDFVPLAERTGAIRPLTTWVLGAAMADAARWSAAGWPLPVAVNVSAPSLGPDLVDEIASGLAAHKLPADLLELEITESDVMLDPEVSRAALDAIAALGVRIAVDDFGTGHSSLAYLQQLPVHMLKLDRAFARELGERAGNRAIVAACVDLGARLGLRVVAEGVEEPGALAYLKAMGCDLAQGYGIARPMPAADLERWLRGLSPPRRAGGGAPSRQGRALA